MGRDRGEGQWGGIEGRGTGEWKEMKRYTYMCIQCATIHMIATLLCSMYVIALFTMWSKFTTFHCIMRADSYIRKYACT